MSALHTGPEGCATDGTDGKVGIGTTSFLSNESLLVQNDSDGSQSVVRRNNSGKIASISIIADNTNAVALLCQGGSGRGGIDANATLIDNSGSGQNGMQFRLNGSCKMRLDSSGNLGINCTNPGEKLEVGGAVKLGNKNGTANGTIYFDGNYLRLRANGTNFFISVQTTMPY